MQKNHEIIFFYIRKKIMCELISIGFLYQAICMSSGIRLLDRLTGQKYRVGFIRKIYFNDKASSILKINFRKLLLKLNKIGEVVLINFLIFKLLLISAYDYFFINNLTQVGEGAWMAF